MEIIKLSIMWENTAPGTESACDFCAGIGPLQLGVVLVDLFFIHFSNLIINALDKLGTMIKDANGEKVPPAMQTNTPASMLSGSKCKH